MSPPVLAWRRAGPADRGLALVLLGGAAGAAALVPWLPLLARLAPGCPFHAWTGLPCPGCGSTRAALALLRGDFTGALALNPLATLAIVLGFAAAALAWPWVEARGPVPRIADPGRGLPRRVRFAALGAVGAQWVWLVARGT